jgi:hypothetical protein
MVPKDDGCSVLIAEIAAKCDIPSDVLVRLLRQAMTYGLFWEPSVGMIAHTELSKEMIRLSPLLSYQLEVCLPSSLRLPEWIQEAHGGTTGSKHKSAFQIAHATTDTWWSYAEKRPELIRNYGLYMALITNGGPHDVSHVVSGFAWGNLGDDAIVFDVGLAKIAASKTMVTNLQYRSEEPMALSVLLLPRHIPISPFLSRIVSI